MRGNPCGRTFVGMKASGRAQALDLSLAVIGVVLTAAAVWSPNVIGTPFAGPTWLKVVWPLLIGAPLALRWRAPLLGCAIIWAGISLQALITGNSPEGLELIFVTIAISYAVAAHSSLRRAVAGLAVTAAGAAIYSLANHDITSGNTGDEWSAAFFATAIVAAWLAGCSSGAVGRRWRSRRGPRRPSGRQSGPSPMSGPGWPASCTTLCRTT